MLNYIYHYSAAGLVNVICVAMVKSVGVVFLDIVDYKRHRH